jgi:mRNA interferase MazF
VLRGDVYQAILSPTKGSEQSGVRPAIIVSRDAINKSSPVVIIVPLTDRRHKDRLYPSQVEIESGEGGATKDSIALCEQVRAISRTRLIKNLGHVSDATIARINAALKNTLDLP